MTTPLSGYGHHFGIGNIPFGIASHAENTRPTCVTRYGDSVIFLNKLTDLSTHKDYDLQAALDQSSLNNFAALPKQSQLTVRKHIQDAIRRDETLSALPKDAVKHMSEVTMHLPVEVGDFTDFSCSHHHVQNAAEAMTGKRSTPPAFFNMPIGYAGRCSSIDVSGTPVYRPLGQHWKGKPMDSEVVFGPCEKMDYELELGCIIGRPLPRNETVLAEDAEEHIFGYVLINDWSARDIQALEMIPLGPLNGKNAGTTMSPWVITTDALESFTTAPPKRVQKEVSYLKQSSNKAINIQLQVDIAPTNNGCTRQTMCASNSSWMYWTLSQCVAHQAIGGCGLRTGDLLATGTMSGEGDSEHGCLLEFMKAKSTPPREYLRDGETVTLSGYCGEGVGFGECVATLLPAKDL